MRPSFEQRVGGGEPFSRIRAGLLLLALMSGPANAGAADADGAETSVCGSLREPLAFWLFRSVAGAADARRIAGIHEIERLELKTRDGRTLGGYRLRHPDPRGYLLVVPGNAMLADQIVGELQFFRERGLDVYVYDYRGYGLSSGKSRLAAIAGDYREIVAHLNDLGYRRRLLYGMSMGGVVLLNAIGDQTGQYDALVVDASPSRISPLGCPQAYDPVNHLPAVCTRIKIIGGERDRVVRLADMQELMAAAQACGAQITRSPEFAHPFQDASAAIQRRRFEAVADFLAP
jgi:alpha-beta hydrolase superfamily lysophospholipase